MISEKTKQNAAAATKTATTKKTAFAAALGIGGEDSYAVWEKERVSVGDGDDDEGRGCCGGGGGCGGGGAEATVSEVECECCGLTEECTPAYISRVRERHLGRWICGLCAEAVKDEIGRSGWPISTAEAIDRHASFFRAFRAVAPPDHAAQHLVAAIARLLRRSLDSPRAAAPAPPDSPRLPTTATAAPAPAPAPFRRTAARLSPALQAAASPLSKAE
uniref:DUF1677 family protein n=1 Tax=Ananas comosus var. bracteatus TaxID=296719 RepID=A0A6V7P8V4_ANACO|nr:unnamed protein product [Ananas comosus var. bracteatus]